MNAKKACNLWLDSFVPKHYFDAGLKKNKIQNVVASAFPASKMWDIMLTTMKTKGI
jgi:hypothetical protein